MSHVTILKEVKDFINQKYSHFINGEYGQGKGSKITVENPATEEILTEFHGDTEEDLDRAVKGALDAFNGEWKAKTPAEKERILNRFADLIEENAEILAQIETLTAGKNINVARFEMAQSADFTRYYAGWATKMPGEVNNTSLPSINGEQYMGLNIREPIGVIGGIIPWNFPIMIAIWKIAAALVTGCTIVVKPSEYTPISSILLAKLAHDAGVPTGAFNIVNGPGRVIGQGLIKHPDIAKISFTGSVPTGANIAKESVEADFTRFTLELGGKNPAVFFEDMTVDEVIAGIIEGGMANQGQICASIERAYIHESIIDEVIEKLPAALKEIKIGSPLDESMQFGTLSNKEQYQQALDFYKRAEDDGDKIIYGGYAIEGKGYFVPPTVILAQKEKSTLMCEETFSPIVTMFPFSDEANVVQLMNDTPFGLTASIWTKDLSRATRMMNAVKAGTVYINTHGILDPSVPFGGIKSSGIGREFGSAFIESYTEVKSVLMRY